MSAPRPAPRLLRLLLTLFPKEFRTAHRRDMELVFREQRAEAAAAGPGSVARLWLATLVGTLRAAPAEHLAVLASDSRLALRRFRSHWGPTAVAVLTLGVAIGATTAVFSLIDHVLLRPLPYSEPERLVHLRPLLDGEESMPGPVVAALEREVAAFSEVMTMEGLGSTIVAGGLGDEGRRERVRRLIVSPNYFRFLGVEAARGRVFGPEDERLLSLQELRETKPSERPEGVAVISHRWWRDRFGASPDAVGSSLEVAGQPHRIVGVLPEDFRVLAPRLMQLDAHREIWYLSNWSRESFDVDRHYLEVFARLAPETTVAEAQAEVDAFCARQRELHPELADLRYRLSVEPLHGQVVGEMAPALWALFGAVSLVLLIACANVAGILLASGAQRRDELGLRLALGASRERLFRLLMTESALIGLAGAALGLLLAVAALHLARALRPESLQRFEAVTVDGPMVAFALGATLLATLLSGTLPSLRLSHRRLLGAGARRRSVGGLTRGGRRAVLVAAQVAICAVLAVAVGILMQSLGALFDRHLGFEPRDRWATHLHIERSSTSMESRVEILRELVAVAESIPGVRGASLGSNVPADGAGGHGPIVSEAEPEREILTYESFVAPGYFETLGQRLLAGRTPTWDDMASTERPVAVLDEGLARRLFPDGDAVGGTVGLRRIRIDDAGELQTTTLWAEVLGVVAAVPEFSLGAEPPETLYVGVAFRPYVPQLLVVDTTLDEAELADRLREALAAVDPELVLSTPRSLDHLVRDLAADLRFVLSLLTVFGGIGLLLAAVGIYAALSQSVRRGAGEIGLRSALGASPGEVLREVLRLSARLTVTGGVIGLALAALIAVVARSRLPMDAAGSWLAFAGTGAVLLATAVVASAFPAARALRVDPSTALRSDGA